MMRLVTDTGPILHLHEAGALHLLPLAGEISLTPLVLAEVRGHVPTLWPATLPAWAHVQPLASALQQQALAWQHAGLLHGGEAESLALAQNLKPDWFLTDDAAARLVAESLGIETHGSLGVLLWAAATKLVNSIDAEKYLAGLESSSLWLSPRVRIEVRRAFARIFAST